MIDPLFDNILPLASEFCDQEENLTLYLDGELPFDAQAELFAHLAFCSACREAMDATLHFRRLSRQESMPVPVSVDEAFFKRLAEQKNRSDKLKVERAVDRSPLWRMKKPVSLGAAIVATVLIFTVGLLVPAEHQVVEAAALVSAEQEFVEFPEMDYLREKTVYVFYPGLEVEATQSDASNDRM